MKLASEETAPSVSPCVCASAALETMLWIEADTVQPSRLQAITTNITHGAVASPQHR